MFKNALVSVSDKTGLVDFLRPYLANGLRVVSTGGTARHLRENGISVVDVSEQTQFPEVMDGRVKTLHPHIHMALLARPDKDEDCEVLETYGLQTFDLVIGNLYPFAQARKQNLSETELLEWIDVGGPSFLRAAAKTYARTTVLCDPKDYLWVSERNELSLEERRALAAKVYAHTSDYDRMISEHLNPSAKVSVTEDSSNGDLSLEGQFVAHLRYGENPQQRASWYSSRDSKGEACQGLHQAQVLQGKELSYNNLLDLSAAVSMLREFSHESPACVVVKHNNPCGVAVEKSVGVQEGLSSLAVKRALEADPVSAFGGILAFNQRVTLEAAQALSSIFLECVVAPEFTLEARELLSAKKNLRLLAWPDLLGKEEPIQVRSILGGYLVQTPDQVDVWQDSWRLLPDQSLDKQITSDLLLAWKVAAHLKSNAIAIAGGGQTLGLGMGQVNRVDAVEQAIGRFQHFHSGFIGVPVLASDAFFPFPDSIEKIAQAGIRWVIQPGGSVKDPEVLARAQGLGVSLVLTGQRHFAH